MPPEEEDIVTSSWGRESQAVALPGRRRRSARGRVGMGDEETAPVPEGAGAPRSASSLLSGHLVGRRCDTKGGRGVFARVDIDPGELLVVWGGSVVTRAELESRPASIRTLTLQVDDDAYLVSDMEGPADWVNHSCDPNAGLRGQISLVALRPIGAGEEVCFDYATSDASDYDEFDCACRTERCRGRVAADDWAIPDVRSRLAGRFSPYIQHLIDTIDQDASSSVA